MSTAVFEQRIVLHEAKRALLNKNNPEEISTYQYHTDMIKEWTAKLPKPKLNLHVAEESLCESCE
jgi:hypothetical protein